MSLTIATNLISSVKSATHKFNGSARVNPNVKGAGEVDFQFFVVSYSGEWQLPGTFFGMKKILFLAKVIEFSNRENTYNYIAPANFNRDSPKINFKIYLLLHFLR